jgi:hypothetical protein
MTNCHVGLQKIHVALWAIFVRGIVIFPIDLDGSQMPETMLLMQSGGKHVFSHILFLLRGYKIDSPILMFLCNLLLF